MTTESRSSTDDGEKLDEESVIQEIERYLDGEMPESALWLTREQIGRTVDYAAGRNRYIGYLITLATRSFKGKRSWPGLLPTAARSLIAKSVFDALGAKTYVINNEPDGTNINTRLRFHPYRGPAGVW